MNSANHSSQKWMAIVGVIMAGFIAVIGLLRSVSPARAGTVLLVTTTADTFDGVCDSQCSIRDAIDDAVNGDTISITVNGTLVLSNTLNVNNLAVTIMGSGPESLAISGNNLNRVFGTGSLTVTLSGMTIRDGNAGVGNGGGIYNSGALTLTNVAVISNTASKGGGIYSNGGAVWLVDSVVQDNIVTAYGGGVVNNELSGKPSIVTMVNSKVLSNTATTDGGGLLSGGRVFILGGSEIAYNQSGHNGGGIWLNGAPFSMHASDIHHNHAATYGGGIFQSTEVATITQSSLAHNTAENSGGGVYVSSGNLILDDNSELNTNSSRYGGGIFLDFASITATNSTFNNNDAEDGGGGLYVNCSTCKAKLTNVQLIENQAAFGAGISNSAGKLWLDYTTFMSNTAKNSGAGIYTSYGTVTMTLSTLKGNTAQNADAGGVYSFNSRITITGTTFEANSSLSSVAGGIRHLASSGFSAIMTLTNSLLRDNIGNDGAGGIYSQSSGGNCWLYVDNVTFTGNQAPAGGGGGLNNFSCNVVINNSTFTANSVGSGNGGGINNVGGVMVLKNSILSDNTDSGGEAPDCMGSLNSPVYNIIEQNNGYCTLDGSPVGNLQGVNANVAPLADNGGPTLTHALLTGSPAINAANPATPGSGGDACLGFDQRGEPRFGACDMGAYETSIFVYLPLIRR